MKLFDVYRHPVHGVEVVKYGFSWPASFFNIAWMMAKRLWRITLVWVIANVVLFVLADVDVDALGTSAIAALVGIELIGFLALQAVPGFLGNQWLAEALIKRGYARGERIEARSISEAREAIAR